MASLIRISSAYTKETDNGTTLVFTVSLDQPNSTEVVTVDFSTVDDTAIAGSDFTAIATQAISFAPNETTQTIEIPILDDTIYERTETFFVQLTNPSANAEIDLVQGRGVGTILDDDPMPTLSIDSVEVSEDATSAVLTVTRSGQSTEIITVNYATVDSDAEADADYTGASGVLVFLPSETTKKITVPITNDNLSEANEEFLVRLSGANNATIDQADGTITILDNDLAPSLSITDVTIAETAAGSNAVFTVTLSAASGQTVTVKYATANDTALAGEDYTATSGTLTFAPGTLTQQITVPILDDLKFELEETFFVNLSDAANASIAESQAIGTITDTDPEATVSITIDDVTIAEGNSGTTIARFIVSLSNASSQPISVDYAVANDTTDTSDWVPTSGKLEFAAGETTKTIEVEIDGDTLDEENETFFVNLSNPVNAEMADAQGIGTITDDDGIPSLSIGDIVIEEGSGLTTAILEVSLSNPTAEIVEVTFTTSDDTATEDSEDYSGNSGTLIFNPGEGLTQTIEVTINGDRLFESNETFLVTLSNAVNATLGKSQGQVTIENDDTLPQISISDIRRITEGDDGTLQATFSVSLSNPDAQTITVDYETSDGIATVADGDYVSGKGQLTFDAGETRKSISVTINGDTKIEPNETFFVNLSNASANAQIARAKATGTIINDDQPPRLSIADVIAQEGNSGTTEATFEVSLDKAYALPVTVDYKTVDETATVADKEYIAASGKLTFAAGQTTQTITVLVNGDTRQESDETFLVELSSATNATIAIDRAIGTIQNDDFDPTNPVLPSLSIDNISLKEGNSGITNATFTLTLSASSAETVTVDYAIADGTATVADGDYTPTSLSSIAFAPGETTKTITVAIQGDTKVETNETFQLNLANPQNAVIAQGKGIATLINDDVVSKPPSDGSDNGSDPGSEPGTDPGSGSKPPATPLVLSGTANADDLVGGTGNDRIYGLDGDDVLNGGAGNDLVHGGGGNDTLYGGIGIDLLLGKHGGDQLLGGDGDDVLFGGKGNDKLYGENGNDLIYGKKGNDLLAGGVGDDTLMGGLGRDRLKGGAGKDQFGFRKSKDKTDRILDFSVKDDMILIQRSGFKAQLKNGTLKANQFQNGKQANDANDRFIYNRGSGALFFDRDGIGGAAQAQIAQLSKNLTFTHQNIMVVAEI